MKHIYTTFKQFITKPLLLAFALLAMSGNAWGYYWAYMEVESSPTAGGKVYVGNSSSCSSSSCSKTSDDATSSRYGKVYNTSGNINFYLCNNPNTGYTFKGWSTDNNNNSGEGVNNNPYTKTVKGTTLVPSFKYYAIFARMAANTPANNSTTNCGDVTIGQNSDWKEIKIKTVHAGTVSISKSGSNASEFYVASTNDSPTSEFTSYASNGTEETKSIFVQFRPTANGLRTCTLTVSSDNGLSSLTYYIRGTGYSTPSITWKDGNGNTLTSGETTLSAGDTLKATCTSSQTVSYSDYNSSYFKTGTDASGAPILIVKEDITGTIKDVSVKGNLAKNTTTHYAAFSETFTLNITNLIPQKIVWNDEISDLLFEGDEYTITLNAVAKNAKTGENSGQAITYSMVANEYMSLSGNVLRVSKVGGPVTITASAAESDTYAPAELKRNATVIDIKSPCADKDTYDDFTVSNLNIIGVTISPTLPKQLSFKVKRGGLGSLFTKPGLVVTQYNSNGEEVGSKFSKSYDEVGSSQKSYTVDCDVNATTILFSLSSIAAMSYEISDIKTTRVTSCTPNQSAISYATEPGQTLSKNLKLSYCNALVFLSLKSDEEADHVGTSKWSLNTTRLGNCGKRGEQFVSISFLSNVKGEYSDVLYIRDNVGTLLSTVDLSASVTVRPQHLDTWNIVSTYNTTDKATLTATTQEGRNNFDFSVKSSNPEGIVSISNTGVMTFNGSGTAQIVAHESGGGIYDEFTSEPRTITINKVTPIIVANPSGTVTYNSALANNQLSGGQATVTLRGVADSEVAGAFEWKNVGETVSDKAGNNYEYPVVFKPTNDAMYNPVDGVASVTVNRADGALAMNNGEVSVSITGDQATLNLDTLKESSSEGNTDAISYEVISANKDNAIVSTNNFSANAAGEYTVRATKAETDYYTSATDEFTVNVTKRDPSVNLDELAEISLTYGEALSSKSFSGNVIVTDLTSDNREDANTLAWVDDAIKPEVGVTSAKATFTSAHTEWFNSIEIDVPITVSPIDANYAATATVYAGQSLSEVELANATTGLNGTVSGSVAWKDDVTAISFDEAGTQTLPIVFTSGDANYNSGEGLCTITVLAGVVFNGGEWTNGGSWLGGEVPTSGDRVIIDADLTITDEVEVTAMTINTGNTVTIADGGSLTIGAGNSLFREEGYGNIIVEAGGKLNLTGGTLQINDYELHSGFDNDQPKSGQTKGQDKLHTNGDAYFVLDLDPNGIATYGWYSFTVPFEVNAMTGVLFANGNPMTNEQHYAIMDYHEDLRAQGKYGWKKYRATLQPNTGYIITVDDELGINTVRFRKDAGAAFNTEMTQQLTATVVEGGATKDQGWNYVGNGTTSYINYGSATLYAQVLNHAANVYDIDLVQSNNMVVGAAYVVQVHENSVLTMQSAYDATTGLLRAPKREDVTTGMINLLLSANGKNADRLFVTYGDEAEATYTIGRDVQKMGTTVGASCPRIWANAKQDKLAAVDLAFVENQVLVPLGIYVPQAGDYTIAMADYAEEDVYLLHNGGVVADLSISDHTLSLNAGTDNDYSLLIVRRVHAVATGVDNLDNNANSGTEFVEKIMMNGQLFILHNGTMFDVQGRKVATF